MNKKVLKVVSWMLLLGGVAALANGCYWWGPRGYRHGGRRWHDGGGWHEGYRH